MVYVIVLIAHQEVIWRQNEVIVEIITNNI